LARRVVLHIGSMKSGTSFLQNVLSTNREALAAHGVQFPGSWRDQVEAVRDIANNATSGLAADGPWRRLVELVDAWPDTAVISMEFLAARSAEEVEVVCASFPDAEVDVVLTARDMTRTIPAMWLESTQNGATETWKQYLHEVRRGAGPAGKDFIRHQDLPGIAERWSTVVGKDHFTLVTVPVPGAPPRLLWERFAGILGVEDVPVELDVRANPSLGLTSAMVLRRFNERYRARNGGELGNEYLRLVKHRLAKGGMVHREGEPKLGFDARWARKLGERQREALRAAGYRVVGDLDELTPRPVRGSAPRSVSSDEQLDAAIDALLHLIADTKMRAERRTGRPLS
jgi:hypothetical protein